MTIRFDSLKDDYINVIIVDVTINSAYVIEAKLYRHSERLFFVIFSGTVY